MSLVSAVRGIVAECRNATAQGTLYVLVMWPIAVFGSLMAAPLGLWNMHLPFDVVPWYLQLLWHVAALWHHFGMPLGAELTIAATNLFVPHLEKHQTRTLTPLDPDQPAPGPIGDNGATLAQMETISLEEFQAMGTKGFFEKYGKTCRLVRIRGLAHAEGNTGSWSLDRFREEFADVEFLAYHRFDGTNLVKTTFGELADQIMKKGPIYGRAIDALFRADPKLRDDVPSHLFRDMRRNPIPHQLQKDNLQMMFWGCAGSRTQIHWDVTTNFNTQVQGEKHWWVFHPSMAMLLYPKKKGTNQYAQAQFDLGNIDHEKFPAAKFIQGYQVTMQPGDVMWLPPWWPHGVFNLSTPTGMTVFDSFGFPTDLVRLNLMGTLALALDVRNWGDALDMTRAKKRWYL